MSPTFALSNCNGKMIYLRILLGLMFIFKMDAVVIDQTETTELIQQRVGYDLKLECSLKGEPKNDEDLNDIKVHWYFKQCSDTTSTLGSCQDSYEDDWTQLPCENNFCKPDLILRNITERYSGLYKCTIHKYATTSNEKHPTDRRLVRTYQLDVKNTTMSLPEFLDVDSQSYLNKTAVLGTQVVFQCLVHSEVHPTVKWFRRIPEVRKTSLDSLGPDNFSSHIVRYNGETYELLATAHEKFISDGTYLSKLIMNNVRLQDEGYYACVAVNYRGHRIRLFYLSVYENDEALEYWTNNDTGYDDADDEAVHTDPTEFWLLFLMPLGLAMLPLAVWLIYFIYKKCCRGSISHTQKQQFRYSDGQMSPELCILTA